MEHKRAPLIDRDVRGPPPPFKGPPPKSRPASSSHDNVALPPPPVVATDTGLRPPPPPPPEQQVPHVPALVPHPPVGPPPSVGRGKGDLKPKKQSGGAFKEYYAGLYAAKGRGKTA